MEPVRHSIGNTAAFRGAAFGKFAPALRGGAPLPAAFVLGAGVAVDQLSKAWADSRLRLRGILEVVPGVLDLRYTRNPGAFFSLGADLGAGVRRTLLSAAGVVVLGLIAALYARTGAGQGRLRWALVLLSSGAAGNLIDRLRSGDVIDFVHLHAGSVLRWATFNVADVLITVGLALLCLELIRPGTAHDPGSGLRRHAPHDGGAST
jgi:signal peptidase II